jgi:hypothetical protein
MKTLPLGAGCAIKVEEDSIVNLCEYGWEVGSIGNYGMGGEVMWDLLH